MSDGWKDENAHRIATWDLYDQNAAADWFDPEWMFGITNGFDIVIGNPPYVRLQKDGGKLGNRYRGRGFTTFVGSGDIYQLFYEKGCQMLKPQHGFLCYITSNKWMRAPYGEKLRKFFVEKTNPVKLLDFGGFQVFENATVDTSVLLTQKSKMTGEVLATSFKKDFHGNVSEYAKDNAVQIHVSSDIWYIGSRAELALMEKIERIGTTFERMGYIN